MALVAMDDDGVANALTDAGWRSAAIDCKARGAVWLRPTASGASVLAYCGAEHSSAGFEDGAHFLSVDVEGHATPSKLVRQGVAWEPIDSDSVTAMATIGDMEGEGLVLAGANALHLLSVSVVESGGEAVHKHLLDLLKRHADSRGADVEMLRTLQSESIKTLHQCCMAAGLDVFGACGEIDTVVYANSRQDYVPKLADRDTVTAMDARGQHCAVGGDAGSIAVLDLKRPDAAPLMKSQESFCVNGVALVDRNGTELATVCSGGLLKVWDWRQGAQLVTEMETPPQEAASLTCVAVRPSTGGTQMVTGSARGVVALWDRRSPDHPVSVFRPHEELVWDMCFDESGSGLVTCSNDGTVAEHEILEDTNGPGGMAQMHWKRRLVEQVMPVNCVAVDQTNGLVAAGTDGNAVYFTTRHDHDQSQPAGVETDNSFPAATSQEEQGQRDQDDEPEEQPNVHQGFARVDDESTNLASSLPPPQATPFGVSPVIGSSGRNWGDWSAPGMPSAISTGRSSQRGPLFTPAPSGLGGKLF